MCYAIPGKVVEISDKIVTVEYFGERKRARNEFHRLSAGDYVYAQGGFVIQKVPRNEALASLETWEELFFKLQETDLRLAREPKDLYQIANATRQRYLGNACCVHGIIEFSNHCRNDCLYCGIRRSNSRLSRYRMGVDKIIERCDYAVNRMGFKALVLQSGEDAWYDEEKLLDIVGGIRKRCATLLVLSIGERPAETYEKLYEAGARGILLRFETGNPALYKKFKPGGELRERIELIKRLRETGYLIFTGFLVGLPGQSQQDVLNDIELTHSLGAEMFSFGPFIPHPDTPLADAPRPSLDFALSAIARARIRYPESKILVTTALETLDGKNGARLGLMSGANSLMINLTPEKYRNLYEIYPNRAGAESGIAERIDAVLDLLRSLGRAPTDLGL